MLLPVILFMLAVPGRDASDVTRDFFGDIFRMRDCHNGSRCDNGGRRAALQVPGRPCYCQCAPSHLAYREDKQQCVKDIKECYMSVFYRPFTVEAIPLVYLPTSGQLVHPDAHLSLSMRRNIQGSLAKCRVTVSQYLTRDGWRTLTKLDGTGGSIFGLFTDANKTYLQFLGSSHDRKLLQQHMVLVRLLCVIPHYPAFETCVGIRMGWVPGVENVGDVPAPSNKANMMVVGLSLGVLALVYIFAVLVYLKIRRQMIAKQKANADQEAKLQSMEDNPEKVSTLHRMETSNRLEMYHSASLGKQKHNRKSYRNSLDPWSQMSPIVETYNRTWTDRMGQHSSEFRAQDFKLQPEFFEPEFMASPPHEVLEYLERLQNSITFARHRMRSCYRYQPTLNGIPEDDYFYQELENKDSQNKDMRTTPDGGSASSVASLQESSEQSAQQKEFPKIPPRKPKRKTVKEKGESPPESGQSSDLEQKEIQKAMNTLNDTLDALEYDIYKQEYLQHVSDSETANFSCQNSTSIDFDDFETSSCSSLSAVTVLGREAKRLSDISKCSSHEKNLSEEISTFSNSTYSLCGLFHDGNKANCNNESEKSNLSSRCLSQSNLVSQTEDSSKAGHGHRTNIKGSDDANINTASEKQANSRPRSRADSVNNFPVERNFSSKNPAEKDGKNAVTSNQKSILQNTNVSNSRKVGNRDESCLKRDKNYFSFSSKEGKQNNKCTSNHHENVKWNNSMSNEDEMEHRRTVSSLQENTQRNIATPNSNEKEHKRVVSPYRENAQRNVTTPNPDEKEPKREASPFRKNVQRNVTTPNPDEKEHKRVVSPYRESVRRNVTTPNPDEKEHKRVVSPYRDNARRNATTPNPDEKEHKRVNSPHQETSQRNITTPKPERIENKQVSSPRLEVGNSRASSPNKKSSRRNTPTPSKEAVNRNTISPSREKKRRKANTINRKKSSTSTQGSVSPDTNTEEIQESDCKTPTELEGLPLRKSPSDESLKTTATDMTTDSLDSRCTTPNYPSPTPSLMEMWISKLVSTSVPYSKNRRKSKKKLILPEDEVDSWEHVCQRQQPRQNPSCPMHDDLNSSEPNLIDKLAHYSSKTMAGCGDVAGYFQSLKQDVLKEHLKQWLSSNNQGKKHREEGNECSHKKPLVNGQEANLVDENGMHLSNSDSLSETVSDARLFKDASIVESDSLESDSAKKIKTNGTIYFGGMKEISSSP